MTATPRATLQKHNVKRSLFPSYVPIHIRVTLYSKEYLLDDTLCEFIDKYKTNNNSTLTQFSQLIGFSLSHICNVLHSKKPSYEFINKIILLRNNL